MNTIPLKGGAVNSHQKFSATLGGVLVDFVLNYITRKDSDSFGTWSLDAYVQGGLVAGGMMLESGAVINRNYQAGIGKLSFVGSDATLDNLGADNHLVWEDIETP